MTAFMLTLWIAALVSALILGFVAGKWWEGRGIDQVYDAIIEDATNKINALRQQVFELQKDQDNERL